MGTHMNNWPQRALLASLLSLGIATGAHAQTLQDFINDHRALEARAQQCNFLVNRQLQQSGWNISHGLPMPPPPQCQLEAPQIIARMAYDETQIRRRQGIPTNYCDTGVCNTPQYIPQPSSRRAPPDTTDMEHIINGEEVTRQGNVMQIGPNGNHHWDCGPGARNVTSQSFNPNPNVCVER